MAETGGTYLPPVIASLVGEVGDMAKTLVEAKAMLEDFSRTETTAKIDASTSPMLNKLAIATQMLVVFSQHEYAAKLGLDTTPFMLEMAKLKAEMALLNSISISRMLAPYMMGAAAGGGGGRGGGLGALLGGMLGGAAGGAGGLPGALGFGSAGFGAGAFGLAGFGSIAAFAGFGFERVITLAIGLVGSLSEALMGLGVIAAGTFATMAVGMGSDMVVMKSTIADTQALSKLWTQLQNDVLVYGANSQQAQLDAQLLNAQLKILGNTAGVQAEMGLAKLAYTINQQFDRASSAARVQAVNLMTQVLLIGQTFVPLVSEAARRNLAIINTALAPLFAWIRGPQGIGIFADLENKFARDLPTAMDAFTQGVEFLLRFLDLASNYTGGFIQMLDRLFTYLNSPAGFARVKKDVQDVVGVFGVWRAFIVILFKDLVLLLGQSVGVGTTMISMLTGILTKLHDYLASTTGKSTIGSLFQAHKQEIIALLELLPKLAGPVALIYINLAVPLTNIATAIANIVSKLISIPGAGPIIAYGLAFQILGGRILGSVLAFGALRTAVAGATAAMVGFDVAADSNIVSIIIIAIIALIVAIVLLITHWKDVAKTVQQVWKDVSKFVSGLLSDVGKFFSSMGSIIEKGWSEFAKRPGYWIGFLIGFVIMKFFELQKHLTAWFAARLGDIVAWGASMAAKAPGAIGQLTTAVMNEANKLPGQLFSLGQDMITGLINGIKSFLPWAGNQVKGFFQGLAEGAKKALGASSPSKVFADIGAAIPQGVAVGVNAHAATALTALASLINQMNARGQLLGRTGIGGPSLALAGGGSLRGPISINAPITVQVQGASAATPQGIGNAVQQAVAKEFDNLVRQLQGGVYSHPGG